jgi:hypothetical protein
MAPSRLAYGGRGVAAEEVKRDALLTRSVVAAEEVKRDALLTRSVVAAEEVKRDALLTPYRLFWTLADLFRTSRDQAWLPSN